MSTFGILFATLLLLQIAEPVGADRLDAYLQGQMRQMHLPGLCVAVVRDGRVATLRSYGLADVDQNSAVTDSTVFEIGSLSKQFTAALILMLVGEGRIDLDGEISSYLPGVPERWSEITIRQLLTHSSGIQNYLLVPGLYDETARPEVTHEAITELLFGRLGLDFPPGETWSYSNSGYLLLGNIIERVSGKSYWQNLDERIFQPLGMKSSRSSQPSATIANRAVGYEWQDGRFERRAALHENAYAAGAIASTAPDMARWALALCEHRLLDAGSYVEMWTPFRTFGGAPPPFNYGFGWFVDTYHGRRVLAHSGGTPGFSSAIYLFDQDSVGVIVLTNHGDRVIDHLAVDIAGLYVHELARPAAPAQDPEPQTTARLREALLGLFEGRPEYPMYTPPMQVFLRTDMGSGLWKWLAADGELKSFAFSEEERTGDRRVLRYRAVLGDVTRWFSFVLDPDRRIAQVNLW